MAIYEQDSDFVRWGLRLLSVEDDPALNYNYYNSGENLYERQSSLYEEGSNDVENDEIIAHTLQEEFSRLQAAEEEEEEEREKDRSRQEPSYVIGAWQSPPRNYSSDNDCWREDSCSTPGDQEFSDDYAYENDLFSKFDHMTAIPHVPRINGEIPSIDEATSDHQRLMDRLQSFGFIEHKVQGDGNCQFRALSDQLYDTSENHKSVRHRIVNQLKSHPEIYEGYVPMAYDDYLEKMSMNGEWGDHVTLQAAADVYAVKIIVLTSFKDTYYIEILPKLHKPKRVIFLSFWAEVHYNSIYLQEDAPSGESRKKRKWWSFGNRH